jgi:hypothetical protein
MEDSKSLDGGRTLDDCSTYYRYHYVNKPLDTGPEGWRVGKHVKYPRYSNDNWARVNSNQWKTHPNSVYAPLNDNADLSLAHRKYIPDSSGFPTYWYRHTIEPTYEWMFEQGS